VVVEVAVGVAGALAVTVVGTVVTVGVTVVGTAATVAGTAVTVVGMVVTAVAAAGVAAGAQTGDGAFSFFVFVGVASLMLVPPRTLASIVAGPLPPHAAPPLRSPPPPHTHSPPAV
jgi:hypothetical protein